MKRIISLFLLIALFFLALSSEWSILSLGHELAKSSFATYVVQGFVVILFIAAIVFVFFNLSLGEKKRRFEE